MSIPPPSDNPNYFQPQVSISPPPSPSTSPPSPMNLSPSIFITLLILSAIIIVTALLVLFFRHLNRLPVPCLIRFRHLPASSPPSAATSLRHRTDDSSNTDANNNAVLDCLPLFTFSSIVRRSSSSSDSDCAVCLSKFKPPDQLRLLPLCCHAFHAECIDAWLKTNQTCPLCRATIHASYSDIAALLHPTSAGNGSFRLEIGSLSRRHGYTPPEPPENARISYSVGSFDYIVDEDSEIAGAVVGDHGRSRSVSDKEEPATPQLVVDPRLAEEVAAGRSWLGDYMDRLSATLSSRTLSFCSSRRFFTGSSRRSEAAAGDGEWDLEASRVGEEISELFRWASGV